MSEAERSAILVTGAAGFVGYHVCNALISQGRKVIGIDNLNAYYDPSLKLTRLRLLLIHPNFEHHKLDLADAAAVEALFAATRPSEVVHLAAQAGVRYSLVNPGAYTSSNIEGFLSVLEACRRYPVKHLIYASSSSVYGANAKAPFSERDPVDHPVSLYAATKRANELMAHTYAHLFAIPTTGLRFFTVYGPWGRPDMAYFKFTKDILEDRPIDLFDVDRMQRDFTYIDDIVEAIIRLIPEAPGAALKTDGPLSAPYCRIFNIGNHTPAPLREFIAILQDVIGKRARINHLPMQPGDVLATHADVAALQAMVGFEPSTQLRVGLERFVRWYRDYHRSVAI